MGVEKNLYLPTLMVSRHRGVRTRSGVGPGAFGPRCGDRQRVLISILSAESGWG